MRIEDWHLGCDDLAITQLYNRAIEGIDIVNLRLMANGNMCVEIQYLPVAYTVHGIELVYIDVEVVPM